MGRSRRPPRHTFPERNQSAHQAAVAQWLGEPGTDGRKRLQQACQDSKPSIEDALEPFRWFIDNPSSALREAVADAFEPLGWEHIVADLRSSRPVSQVMVAVFLSGVFEMAFVTPFGKFDPSRFFSDAANHVLTAFSLASGRDSMEMDALATELRARIDWVKDRLRQMATAMDGAGTPMDPVHETNLVVLGELILCSVDWTLPAREPAAMLSATGLIAFSMDFRGLKASDHASAGLERDAAAFRKAQRVASGHSHIVQPYAGGGKRKSGRRGLAGASGRFGLNSRWSFRMPPTT